MFNTSVSDIMKLNKLTNNLIKVGSLLLIPFENENQYIVKSGDTLYSIAKMFGKSVNDIKELNNLSSDILSINQLLKV